MRIVQATAELLLEKKLTLSVCESCTGGMFGSMLTCIPGSSRYFSGGIIAYSNQVKQKIVGIHYRTLKRYGAVSAEVAKEMAQGVRRKFKTDLGLAITGIAGPTGGTSKKPVGTVYICITAGQYVYIEHHKFTGQRSQIRKAACTRALRFLRLSLIKNKQI
ncbi:MAG: nicotinamide-nucleotide amidohydrolase family protein [bacterium]